jgi:hypothetical protein
MHLFTRLEILRELKAVGFRVRDVRPISPRPQGTMAWPYLLPGCRAYGFLLAATKMDH